MVSGACLVVLMADMTRVDVYGQISLPMHVTDATDVQYAADVLMLLMRLCC